MKIALGLFHFNVQFVAGDLSSYHRYSTQAIIPFLEAMADNPQYRTSMEIAGTGLEFLAENYREAITLLRDLINRDQIEFISSTYAPTLWPAFPGRDLAKSIELNQACLSKLALKPGKIFFAQEAFFGPGLEAISNRLNIAVCKDDYLRVLSNHEISRPLYRLGNLTVVVGCNHILNELAASVVKASQSGNRPVLSSFYEARLEEAVNSSSHSGYELIDGTLGDVQWHWYHVGGGHHFATPVSPHDWTSFFFDPSWMRLNLNVLDSLLAKGYRLGFITEFVEALQQQPAGALPPIVEGSWDPKKSRGVYAWMGWQEHHWENDAAILGLAWRSREAIRQCELMIEQVDDSARREELEAQLAEAWKQQILAESSNPLGRAPLPVEVNFGKECAENTLRLCTALKAGLSFHSNPAEREQNLALSALASQSEILQLKSKVEPAVFAELIGAEGTLSWFSVSDTLQVCEARFRAVEPECGVRFSRSLDHIAYCPSGLEERPARIDFRDLRQPINYLPLANGLISLSENLHLIRINHFGQVAVRVSTSEPWCVLVIEGSHEVAYYRWRFILLRGSLQDAVDTANRVNRT